jgi:hypothetical protein
MPTLHQYTDEEYEYLVRLTPAEDQFRNYMKDPNNDMPSYDCVFYPYDKSKYIYLYDTEGGCNKTIEYTTYIDRDLLQQASKCYDIENAIFILASLEDDGIRYTLNDKGLIELVSSDNEIISIFQKIQSSVPTPYIAKTRSPDMHILGTMHDSLSSFIDLIKCPKNEEEYKARVDLTNQLIDIIGQDEGHPYAEYLHLLRAVVYYYLKMRHPTESDTYDAACASAFQHLISTIGLTEQQWVIVNTYPIDDDSKRCYFKHTGKV